MTELISRIWDKANMNPHMVAVAHKERQLTYGELVSAANIVAEDITTSANASELIGLFADKSVEAVIGILGILKAGHAYVPLDPSHPVARQLQLLESLRIRLVVTTPGATHMLNALPVREYKTDNNSRSCLKISTTPYSSNDALFSDLAYVLHTSGTTGKPKSIGMLKEPVDKLIAWQINESAQVCGPFPSTLQFAPLSFDVSFQEILSTLGAGGQLIIVPEEDRLDPVKLLAILAEQKIIRFFVPPVVLHRLAEAETEISLPDLREVIVAGEQLRITPSIISFFQRMLNCRLVNQYGPTETHVVTYYKLRGDPSLWPATPPIGHPLPWVDLKVLDSDFHAVPDGQPGELFIGGGCLAAGYIGRSDLTNERFIINPIISEERFYRTGDLVTRNSFGEIEYLGRIDRQVKIRGVRIELAEVEVALSRSKEIESCCVDALEDPMGGKRLIAYVVPKDHKKIGLDEIETALRKHLRDLLPEHFIPSVFILLDKIPVLPNGKTDRKALEQLAIKSNDSQKVYQYRSDLEELIASLWCDATGIRYPNPSANFFDIGGHSLALAKVQAGIKQKLGLQLPITVLLEHPTIETLANRINDVSKPKIVPSIQVNGTNLGDIAIIGMSCRFPGAPSLGAYWSNLLLGKESIVRRRPNAEGIVRASAPIDDIDKFDADLFGLSGREAELLDPQHRIFLECAWEVFEDAGYDPDRLDCRAGVFAGCGLSSYLINNVHPNVGYRPQRGFIETMEDLMVMIGTDKDYLPTRVAYRLGLTGPAVNIQTACSTALVAVHLACKSLLGQECELALAGAATVLVPQGVGHAYQPGMVFSSDGYCRPFDADAEGTVFGNGTGIVLLKRLEDAIRDRDSIYAVIKGSAINNDGNDKVGFTAPSVSGQTAVISAALNASRLDPSSISYIECHGTATSLGDAVEIEALKRALGEHPSDSSCFLGSVKSNIGHLGWAAGMAGLIKTALALKYRSIPATLNFSNPNPELHIESSRFQVADKRLEWKSINPRRAAVSAFGVGGTNAHIVLEEAPLLPRPLPTTHRETEVLTLSAASSDALGELTERYANWLDNNELEACDVAFTTNTGRRQLNQRLAVTGKNRHELSQALRLSKPANTNNCIDRARLAFVYSGHGCQTTGMGRQLFETQPVFRSAIELCDATLYKQVGLSLIKELYAASEDGLPITNMVIAQPLLFSFQIALTEMWRSFGITPSAVIGHSVGEFAAAWAAGVFELKEGLRIVAERGHLLGTLADNGGATLSAMSSLKVMKDIAAELTTHIDVAAENSPTSTVVSGPTNIIEKLENRLELSGIKTKRLAMGVAAHSSAMDEIAPRFAKFMNDFKLRSPILPIASNVTGKLVNGHMGESEYWGHHIRHTVRFKDGIETLASEKMNVFMEIGPKAQLISAAEECLPNADITWLSSLKPNCEWEQIAECVSQLYQKGFQIDWSAYEKGFNSSRVHLPTYPFQRNRYWIGPEDDSVQASLKMEEVASVVRWIVTEQPKIESMKGRWLLFADKKGIGKDLSIAIKNYGGESIVIETASESIPPDSKESVVDLASQKDINRIISAKGPFRGIIYLAEIDGQPLNDGVLGETITTEIWRFCNGLINISKAAIDAKDGPIPITIVTAGAQSIEGSVDKLTAVPLWSLARVISMEHPELGCKCIDVNSNKSMLGIDALAQEINANDKEDRVALRDSRYVARLEKLSNIVPAKPKIENHTTCLITGGLGGLGLFAAEWAVNCGAKRLVLVGRSAPNDYAQQVIDRLKNVGAEVIVFRGDVTDKSIFTELLEVADNPDAPLKWVIHSAGALADVPVLELDQNRMHATLDPKVIGAWNLHLSTLARGCKLDKFILFSSVVGTIGNPGQANHAASNAFLDALATMRQNKGLPSQSIAWGAWTGVGTLAGNEAVTSRLATLGFGFIPADRGFDALDTAFSSNSAHLVFAPMEWSQFLKRNNLDATKFFANFNSKTDVSPKSLNDLLCNMSDKLERSEAIAGYVRSTVVSIIGGSTKGINSIVDERSLFDYGLDSLSSLQIRNALQKELGRRLPPTLLFECPTIKQLTERIEQEIETAGIISATQTVSPSPICSNLNYPSPIKESTEPTRRMISAQQKRWLKLLKANYGRLLVPIIFDVNANEDAFRRALHQIVERHEVLRWRYENEEAFVLSPEQVVLSFGDLFEDLSHLTSEELRTALADRSDKARQLMPDPSLLPSWTIHCLVLNSTRFLALLSVQHLEFDGASISLFIDELRQLYGAELSGNKVNLPTTVPYTEYISWQKEYLSDAIKEDRAFFEGFYSSVDSPMSLPKHDGFIPTASFVSGRHSFTDKSGLMASLRRAASYFGVTPFAIMASAYARLLAEITGQNDVLIGTIVAGRPVEQFRETIGPFVAPFPIPISVAGHTTVSIARRWNDMVARVNGRGAYPVADLTLHTSAFRGLPTESYFTDAFIMFNNYPRESTAIWPKAEVLECLAPVADPLFSAVDNGLLPEIAGLFLIIDIWLDEPRFNFWYHLHRFSASTVDNWAQRYLELLRESLKETGELQTYE